jgi:hypothetical protein
MTTPLLYADPQKWLRLCPIHRCLRTECNTKHSGEAEKKIVIPKNYHLCFKNALGYLIYNSGVSITTIQNCCGGRQNLNSLFRISEHSMSLRSVYRICNAANIQMDKVFELTNEYMRLFEGGE